MANHAIGLPSPDAPAIDVEEQEASEAASGRALADLDRSGWPPHPGERRDFYHRIRMFPPEVSAWRRQMLRHLADEPARFPRAASASREQIQAWLDDGISYLREVARILAVLYGTPDLGNKPDPTDELVYIILARHTARRLSARLRALLKQRFARWDDLLDARGSAVKKLVYSGGLSGKKTTALRAALARLRQTFGSCNPRTGTRLVRREARGIPVQLPEMQRKSYCIMMYSFGRRVPVRGWQLPNVWRSRARAARRRSSSCRRVRRSKPASLTALPRASSRSSQRAKRCLSSARRRADRRLRGVAGEDDVNQLVVGSGLFPGRAFRYRTARMRATSRR